MTAGACPLGRRARPELSETLKSRIFAVTGAFFPVPAKRTLLSITAFFLLTAGAALPRTASAGEGAENFGIEPLPQLDISQIREIFSPLDEPLGLDPAKVALGRRLFNDTMLSSDRTLSCESCHRLSDWGMDGMPVPMVPSKAAVRRNTPSVFNAGLQFAQNWDGVAQTLEELIPHSISETMAMGEDWKKLTARLRHDNSYRRAFRETYRGEISKSTIVDALAVFLRSLVTLNAPFDRFLRGNEKALDEEQRKGLGLFITLGCSSCHQGVLLGGNLYQALGIYRGFFAESDSPEARDLGRFAVTGDESDRYVFKVPSLRNVAKTAPYLHNGSVETLEKAVKGMAHLQLARNLEAMEISAIVSFLESLTGELPEGIQTGDIWSNR